MTQKVIVKAWEAIHSAVDCARTSISAQIIAEEPKEFGASSSSLDWWKILGKTYLKQNFLLFSAIPLPLWFNEYFLSY